MNRSRFPLLFLVFVLIISAVLLSLIHAEAAALREAVTWTEAANGGEARLMAVPPALPVNPLPIQTRTILPLPVITPPLYTLPIFTPPINFPTVTETAPGTTAVEPTTATAPETAAETTAPTYVPPTTADPTVVVTAATAQATPPPFEPAKDNRFDPDLFTNIRPRQIAAYTSYRGWNMGREPAGTERYRQFLLGRPLFDHMQLIDLPRSVTLTLIDLNTREAVHGGGDLYLTELKEDGSTTLETWPNDGAGNPVTKILRSGVHYRFGQLTPAPDGFAVTNSFLFYLDDQGTVWDAYTHTPLPWPEKDTVYLETELGPVLSFGVRSTEVPEQQLPSVPLVLRTPLSHNQIPDLKGATYWQSTNEPLKLSVVCGWECEYALDFPLPGYSLPDPIRFRMNPDGATGCQLQIWQDGAWQNSDSNELTLTLEPNGDKPVRFSIVERGSEAELSGFTAYIICNGSASLIDEWSTTNYAAPREKYLAPGSYTFCGTFGPDGYTGLKPVYFKVEGDGSVLFGDGADGPWTASAGGNLVRLEAVKGQKLSIQTVIADSLGTQTALPFVRVNVVGENGVSLAYETGSEPLVMYIEADVIHEVSVYAHPWTLTAPAAVRFRLSSDGRLFILGTDGSETEAAEPLISLVFQ